MAIPDWSTAKQAVKHRYVIREYENVFWEERFALFDTVLRRLVFRTSSYVTVIKEAQRRNGFAPIDGDSRTYRQQIKEQGR